MMHEPFWIAVTGHHSCRHDLVDALQVFGRKLYIFGSYVLFQVFYTLGTGDSNNIFSLCPYPCNSELGRRASFLSCQLPDLFDQLKIFVKIVSLEAGHMYTIIIEVLRCPDPSTEKTTTERRVGYQ